jgi:excisionase family DNA binding protein
MTPAPASKDMLPLMTPADLSEYLGVPLGTLANWRYQHRGPAFVRLGRHVRYRADDVYEWILAQLNDVTRPTRDGIPTYRPRLHSARG